MAERNFERELKELRGQYTESKNEEIRIATKLEEAKKRRKEAVAKVKERGYEVKDLKNVIKTKEEELGKLLDEAKTYLPGEADGEEEFDLSDE